MRFFRFLIASVVVVGAAPAFAQTGIPDVNGVWKPLSADDRLMTIKLAKGTITIEARDLSCALSDLKREPNASSKDPPSVTAHSVCGEEAWTNYSKMTLTLLRADRETYLIMAAVLVREVNENSDPKVDKAHTNEPASIQVYRRVRK
jgi:hypothetical protein